jgi:small multidrug resistance family-3 protein
MSSLAPPTRGTIPEAGSAAYGGVFIILSIFWDWFVEGVKPDLWDIVGMLICMVGAGIIMYAPRGN